MAGALGGAPSCGPPATRSGDGARSRNGMRAARERASRRDASAPGCGPASCSTNHPFFADPSCRSSSLRPALRTLPGEIQPFLQLLPASLPDLSRCSVVRVPDLSASFTLHHVLRSSSSATHNRHAAWCVEDADLQRVQLRRRRWSEVERFSHDGASHNLPARADDVQDHLVQIALRLRRAVQRAQCDRARPSRPAAARTRSCWDSRPKSSGLAAMAGTRALRSTASTAGSQRGSTPAWPAHAADRGQELPGGGAVDEQALERVPDARALHLAVNGRRLLRRRRGIEDGQRPGSAQPRHPRARSTAARR